MTIENNLKIRQGKNQPRQEIQLVDYLKEKIKKLKLQLRNTKIFLNMVIHEMRNPALSIELALAEALKIIENEK